MKSFLIAAALAFALPAVPAKADVFMDWNAKADAIGNKTDRARLNAMIKRITNMPMVADCAAVRQRLATSVTGLGSLTVSAKRAARALSISTRR